VSQEQKQNTEKPQAESPMVEIPLDHLSRLIGPRSLAVRNANGEEIFLRQSTFQEYDRIKPAKHPVVLQSLSSIAPWGKEMIPEGKHGWLFWGDENSGAWKIHLIPDTDPFPKVESAVYRFGPTDEAELWGYPTFSLTLSQKQFKELIETSARSLADSDAWLKLAMNIKVVQSLKRDSIQEDSLNRTILYESKTQKGSVDIPKKLYLNLTLFEGGSHSAELEFLVDLDWPEGSPNGPKFIFRCPEANTAVREAIEAEVMTVADELGDRVKTYQGLYLPKR